MTVNSANTHLSMIGTSVRLHDIADAEGFIAKAILKSGVITTDQEFDELKAEGLVILCDLAQRFEPHRPGYAQPGRFSGYAARFLPGRLQDAWKRLHPEHRQINGEWEYGQPPLSLDLHEGHEADDRRTIEPAGTAFRPEQDPGRFPIVDRAILTLPTAARAPALRYLELTTDGHGVDTVASTMGMRRGDIQRLRSDLRVAIVAVQAEAA